jgi:hypothetical protein
MQNLRAAIESFAASSQQPALSEPGEEMIELRNGNLVLDEQNGSLLLQAWDDRRNIARKVTGIESQTKARLTLRIERFGGKQGTLALIDLQRTDTQAMGRRSAKLEFREVFRRFLRRTFTGYKIVELSTDQNLEQSLSSIYPRALLRQGSTALAAIGAAADGTSPDSILSFGLIWLDYLRRREPSLPIRGLALFLPQGQEKTTALRIRCLDPAAASYSLFVYGDEGRVIPIDPADCGNVDTRLDLCRVVSLASAGPLAGQIAAIGGVETAGLPGGVLSFRVLGLEFARYSAGDLTFGLETRRPARASNLSEIQAIAGHLVSVRSADAQDRRHPLYTRNPESWLESQVRTHIEQLDPSLVPAPIYGQVPAFAAAERGVIDLLALDRDGRLAVIELKASADIDLPCQALDYWIRVKWHLDRNEFSGQGYFAGMELRTTPPRLLLVAPALEFHPSNERVLRFFSRQVSVERLGVGLEWQKQLKLMYRM